MDQIKFGKFLSVLRNEKDLTQEQVSELLNVGSKTVSKWECGNSMPDFETIIKISEIFNVTLFELSNCERIKDKTLKKEDIIRAINRKQLSKLSRKRKIMLFFSLIISIILLISFIYTTNNFNRTQVYELQSLNEDYHIYGTFSKNKTYSVLAITKINYIDKKTIFDKITINSYDFELYSNDEKIYNYNLTLNENEKKNLTLHDMIDRINIFITSKQFDIENINNSKNLILTINYKDINNKNKNQKIEIGIKLNKKYSNTSIWQYI